jgi:predicted Zn-dependent protease
MNSLRAAAVGLVALTMPLCALDARAASVGEKMYQEFLESDQIYPDQAWQDYLQRVGDRLVAHSRNPDDKIHFTLLDVSAINAFATPGGYIFVNRGLIAYLESEDQLAAVLGHEIAHVTERHVQSRNGLAQIGNIAGFIGAILTGTGAIYDATNTAVATVVSGYGRDQELEADAIGSETMAKAGYDPTAVMQMLAALKDNEQFSKTVTNQPPQYHGLFASHPQTDKRLQDAVLASKRFATTQVAEPVDDFWAQMNGMIYGNQAAAGIVKGRAFFHGGLRFAVEFPEGWDVSSTSNRVIGRAQTEGLKGFITLQRQNAPKEPQTSKEYVTETLKRDDLTGGEESTVNGYDAFVGTLDASKSKSVVSMIAVLQKGSNVYLFKGEGPSGTDVKAFEDAFRATVQSFRDLTTADLRTANDQRIVVVEAKPGDTYASLAAKSSIKNHAEETLRLINQDYPHGEPRAGDLVKIIQ